MAQPPISVKRGVTLVTAAFLINTCHIWLNPENWQGMQSLSLHIWAAYGAINILLILLLIKTWQGKNWAKWLLFLWFLIVVSFLLIRLIFDFELATDTLVEVCTTLIECVGWYQLFSRDSTCWFNKNTIVALTHPSSGTR